MEFDESAYLRGRKVGVKLALRLDESVDLDDCGTETVFLRLSNNHVAAIEEEFGGVVAFSDAMIESPNTMLRRFFALALDMGEAPLTQDVLKAAGARLIDSEWPAYRAAVEALWLLAHGGSEDEAGKAWKGRLEITRAGQTGLSEVFEQAVDALFNNRVQELLIEAGLVQPIKAAAAGKARSGRGSKRVAGSRSSGG